VGEVPFAGHRRRDERIEMHPAATRREFQDGLVEHLRGIKGDATS
jgi:hypothetical protein